MVRYIPLYPPLLTLISRLLPSHLLNFFFYFFFFRELDRRNRVEYHYKFICIKASGNTCDTMSMTYIYIYKVEQYLFTVYLCFFFFFLIFVFVTYYYYYYRHIFVEGFIVVVARCFPCRFVKFNKTFIRARGRDTRNPRTFECCTGVPAV